MPQLQEEHLCNIKIDASSRKAGASNVKGVVAYPELLAAQKIGWLRLSHRVNIMGSKIDFYNSLIDKI